jgi:hypothetical protein
MPTTTTTDSIGAKILAGSVVAPQTLSHMPSPATLYRNAGRILDIDGVEQTTTSLVMRKRVDYRVTPLLTSLANPS